MNLNGIPGLIVERVRRSVFWSGLSWGLLQLAVLLLTFGPASPGAQIGVLLVLGIAFLAGYGVVSTERILRALPISQFIGFGGLFLVVETLPTAFNASFNASFPGVVPNSGAFLPVYFGGLAILSFIIAIVGTILGSFVSEWLKKRTQPRLTMDDYRLLFVSVIVILLAASSAIFAAGLLAQTNDLSSKNASLRLSWDSLSSRVANPTYNYSDYIANQVTKTWTAGTQNISLWYTGFAVNSGYIQVSWNASVGVSFNIRILDVTVSTLSGTSGSFRMPVVKSPPIEDIAWFHRDGCPMACSAGTITYTIIYWF